MSKQQVSAHIVVIAGQSNAVGVGHVDCLPAHFDAARIERWSKGYANVPINYYSHDKKSGGFVPTGIGCTELTKHTIGPELGIAEELDRRFPEGNYYIVKCAFGATSLWCDWLSPSCGGKYGRGGEEHLKAVKLNDGMGDPANAGWCYWELVKLLRESIAALEAKGMAPSVRAFCWMQGEGDADVPEHAEKYEERYAGLISDFCDDFRGYIDDNCVFADAGISTVWPLHVWVNDIKRRFASGHENCVFIDTIAAGLTTEHEPFGEPDIYHYDSDCVIRLGQLFTEAFAGPEFSLELEDNEWPFEFTDHDRDIVRAIVFDDDGLFYFVRAVRNDIFGEATLIETSGGGVEPGEDQVQAIKRELAEELGVSVRVLAKIGVVSDYYNLIHRHNINNYFLCQVTGFGDRHLTQEEVECYHLSTLRLTFEEAVREYGANSGSRLGRLVANRELPVLKRAGIMLNIPDK